MIMEGVFSTSDESPYVIQLLKLCFIAATNSKHYLIWIQHEQICWC